MKQLFLKHKIIILRTLGGLMLLVGFASYFWTTPKAGYTQNEIAAANVARMEAKSSGGSSQGSKAKPKSSSADILKSLKDTQESQSKYLTIFMMIFGVGFLGYTFIPKKEDQET